VTVVQEESRSVKLDAGTFTDNPKPLEVHIYVAE